MISATGDIAYNNTTGVISYTDPSPRTDAVIRGLISATGDIAYDATTGVISYTDTDRSDATIRGLLSAIIPAPDMVVYHMLHQLVCLLLQK